MAAIHRSYDRRAGGRYSRQYAVLQTQLLGRSQTFFTDFTVDSIRANLCAGIANGSTEAQRELTARAHIADCSSTNLALRIST
jgi:hypothetical protein